MTKAKILIVEDERIVSKDICETLENLGYEVLGVAVSGKEAIEKTAEMKPDLVLMDTMLKGAVDGIETAKKIKDKFRIPIVYLTAFADDKTLRRAKITEPFGYILKPFEENELHTTIEMAIHKSKMERKLRESEEKYRTLVETSHDLIWTTDRKGIFTFINNRTLEITGHQLDKVIGKNSADLIYPDDLPKAREHFLNVIHTGEVQTCELRIKDKTGVYLTLLVTEIPLCDNDEVYGVMAFGLDITARKEVEENLRASEERYREVVENASDLIFRIDIEGNFTFLNAMATKATGYSEEELLKMNYAQLVHTEDVDQVRSYFEKQFQERSPEGSAQFRINTKSGKIFWLEGRFTILRKGKMVLGWQSVTRDITDQKNAELDRDRHLNDLEKFQKLTVGRELQMIELKKKIKELEAKLADTKESQF